MLYNPLKRLDSHFRGNDKQFSFLDFCKSRCFNEIWKLTTSLAVDNLILNNPFEEPKGEELKMLRKDLKIVERFKGLVSKKVKIHVRVFGSRARGDLDMSSYE